MLKLVIRRHRPVTATEQFLKEMLEEVRRPLQPAQAVLDLFANSPASQAASGISSKDPAND